MFPRVHAPITILYITLTENRLGLFWVCEGGTKGLRAAVSDTAVDNRRVTQYDKQGRGRQQGY